MNKISLFLTMLLLAAGLVLIDINLERRINRLEDRNTILEMRVDLLEATRQERSIRYYNSNDPNTWTEEDNGLRHSTALNWIGAEDSK